MSDDDVDSIRVEMEYEPPVLFDLGSVFDITFGSNSGSSDAAGQAFE